MGYSVRTYKAKGHLASMHPCHLNGERLLQLETSVKDLLDFQRAENWERLLVLSAVLRELFKACPLSDRDSMRMIIDRYLDSEH